MSHYLQKVRNIEILQMKVEFLRDENNNLWFAYAKDINTRKRHDKHAMAGQGQDSKRTTEAMAMHAKLHHN